MARASVATAIEPADNAPCMNPSESKRSSLALAIETSGRIGSVALMDQERLLSEQSFSHGLMHAAQLVPLIDRMLMEAGRGVDAIETVYFSHGPGSFTGLRIGATLAKTLAFAKGVRIVTVPTLRILAENAPEQAKDLIVVLDAKRGQIFTARFQRDQTKWVEVEPAHLDTLADMLGRAPRPVYLLGEGIAYHEQFIPSDDHSIIRTAPQLWQARAAVVGRLGRSLALRGCYAEADALQPLYIRPPEAEEKWDARMAGGKN